MSSFVTNPVTGVLEPGTPFTRIDVPSFWGTITKSQVFGSYEWNITNSLVGKMLGGSQAHNGMIWAHPTQNNVANWGITGWDFNQYIPYIALAENYTGSGFTDLTNRGTSGPVSMTIDLVYPAETELINVAVASGLPLNPNFDSTTTPVNGVGYFTYNMGTGIRQSNAQCYLAPIYNTRSNLVTSIYSQATKILFTTVNGVPQASGVQYVVTNPTTGIQTTKTAHASKEVIITAGGLNTPKLLILSGIGPSSQLSEWGITPLVVNENVGKNIRNHILYPMSYAADEVIFPNGELSPSQTLEYGTDQTGFWASAIGQGSVQIRIKTLSSLVDSDIIVLPTFTTAGLFNKSFSMNLLTANPVYDGGVITLASSNPLVDPIYTPNAIPAADYQTLVRGVQAVRNIMNQPAAVDYFGEEQVPGASASTPAEILAAVESGSIFVWHYYGSAKMGNAGDNLRVVDNNLNVVGVNNLRVIDSSVIPGVVSLVLQAAITGIAEKGSALVLQHWGQPSF
jgi:choline dehydrogenase